MPNNAKDFIYDLFSIEGKTAIITGGSQGIGENLTSMLRLRERQAGVEVRLSED